jgi:phospholipase C
MEKLANSPEHLSSMERFYEDCESGDLPSYSWINPRSGINVTTGVGANDQLPDHDVRAGEQYYKDIYEALRSSPAWNETLFIITYDGKLFSYLVIKLFS